MLIRKNVVNYVCNPEQGMHAIGICVKFIFSNKVHSKRLEFMFIYGINAKQQKKQTQK